MSYHVDVVYLEHMSMVLDPLVGSSLLLQFRGGKLTPTRPDVNDFDCYFVA